MVMLMRHTLILKSGAMCQGSHHRIIYAPPLCASFCQLPRPYLTGDRKVGRLDVETTYMKEMETRQRILV